MDTEYDIEDMEKLREYLLKLVGSGISGSEDMREKIVRLFGYHALVLPPIHIPVKKREEETFLMFHSLLCCGVRVTGDHLLEIEKKSGLPRSVVRDIHKLVVDHLSGRLEKERYVHCV